MKVLLIDLPLLNFKTDDYNIGLCYLLGYMKHNNVECESIDFRYSDYVQSHIKNPTVYTSTEKYEKFRNDKKRADWFRETVEKPRLYVEF